MAEPQPALRLMPDKHLGRYEVLEEVGRGGMAVVYRGRDTESGDVVAIKVLHKHLTEREDARARFQREARAISRLSHPNILEFRDFSQASDREGYIVTEFIEGPTLRDFMDEHPVRSPEVAAMVGLEICAALRQAHDLGIIHRDIKSENVMIRPNHRLVLTDFGIARMVDLQNMTVTGALLGSPAHMSPEMIDGHRLDYRADIFSLGTVLYELATGEMPFVGANPHMILRAIRDNAYTVAEQVHPAVGTRFSRIIDRCMARNRDERMADIAEVTTELERYLYDHGLDDPAAELARAFEDPESYRVELEARLVVILQQRGQTALKNKRVAAALNDFGRAMAYDPDNAEIQRRVRSIAEGGGGGRTRALVIVALLLVAVMIGVGLSYLFRSSPDDDTGGQPEPLATAVAVLPPDAGARDVESRGVDVGHPVRVPSRSTAAVAAAQQLRETAVGRATRAASKPSRASSPRVCWFYPGTARQTVTKKCRQRCRRDAARLGRNEKLQAKCDVLMTCRTGPSCQPR